MLSVVIPTFNRCNNLIKNYEMIEAALSKEGIIHEIIFVDDGSKDGSRDILEDLSKDVPTISSVILSGNSGQQNATLAGIRQAKYPFVLTIDDDLSYDPQSMIDLFYEMDKGYSVVYGVPVDKHSRTHRKLGTRGKELVFFLLLGKPFGIRLTSFRIMNRQVVDYVKKDDKSKVYISARILMLTKNISNIPVIRLSKGEKSHYTIPKLVGLMLEVVCNYTFVSRIVKNNNEKQYEIKEIF